MELEDNNHVSSFLDGDLMGFDSMVHFWVPKSWMTVKPQHYQMDHPFEGQRSRSALTTVTSRSPAMASKPLGRNLTRAVYLFQVLVGLDWLVIVQQVPDVFLWYVDLVCVCVCCDILCIYSSRLQTRSASA